MRLLIIGQLDGPLGAAGRIATQRGAKVAHIDGIAGALNALRNGQGADLAMCDIALDIGQFIDSLKSERINIPVVACGIGADAPAAVRAIRAGAKEYVPLPPDADLIAAVLCAFLLAFGLKNLKPKAALPRTAEVEPTLEACRSS